MLTDGSTFHLSHEKCSGNTTEGADAIEKSNNLYEISLFKSGDTTPKKYDLWLTSQQLSYVEHTDNVFHFKPDNKIHPNAAKLLFNDEEKTPDWGMFADYSHKYYTKNNYLYLEVNILGLCLDHTDYLKKYNKVIKVLTDGLRSNTIALPKKTFRGVDFSNKEREMWAKKKGEVITLAGFTSSSSDESKAFDKNTKIIIHIKGVKGARPLQPNETSYTTEQEVLFAPYSWFHVQSAAMDNVQGKFIIELDWLHDYNGQNFIEELNEKAVEILERKMHQYNKDQQEAKGSFYTPYVAFAVVIGLIVACYFVQKNKSYSK